MSVGDWVLFLIFLTISVSLFAYVISLIVATIWGPLVVFRHEGFTFSSYRTDRRTGLPTLPEGWTWTVKLADKGLSYESLTITLKDANGTSIGFETTYTRGKKNLKAHLRKDAVRILSTFKKDLSPSIRAANLVGVYPPKNLNKV